MLSQTNLQTLLVIPCFNEALRLNETHVLQLLEISSCNILFVNDGSTDDTTSRIHRMIELRPGQIDLLDLPENVGKAEAVRQGFLFGFERTFQTIGFVDADMSASAEDVARLMVTIEQDNELAGAIGSRVALLGHEINRSFLRHLMGRGFATLSSHILGISIYDTQCGAKVFRNCHVIRNAFLQPFRSRWGFDVELISRVLANSELSPGPFKLIEVPLLQWRDGTESRLSLASSVRTACELIKMRSSLKVSP